MRTLLALLAGLVIAGAAVAQPANDSCAAATAITSLPFAATVDTTAATIDPGDPSAFCNFAEEATVWFTYTASRDVTLLIDTIGSDYGNTVSVYTGGCAAPSEVACGYDHDFDGDTELVVPVADGTTVHLLVAGDSTGGNLVLHVARAAFDATPPVSVQAVVASGDPTPIGGGFSSITRPVMLSKTDIAFTGTTTGIFVNDGSSTTTIAVSGDPTPLGGTWGSFGQSVGGAGGTVAFVASLNGASTDSGLFAYSGGTTSPLVVRGDPAPGGGTFVNFVRGIAITPNGLAVAFIADTTLSPSESLWLAGVGGGVFGPLLTEQVDPSPCGSGTVTAFGNAAPVLSINDAGEIALFARSNSPNRDQVLLFSGGWTAIACEGDPTPLGGTYAAITRNVRISNVPPAGQVAFIATVALPGPNTEAVFRATGGVVSVVAADGDLTTGGETITGFASTAVADINASGTVVFHASIGSNAILTAPVGGPATTIARVGGPCPAGGIFATLDTWVDTDASGAAVVRAACTGGFGIFRVSGAPPVTIALQSTATSAGPGFSFDNPTAEGTSTAFNGSRTGVYRVHCDAAGCGPVAVVAQPLTAVPGPPGESIGVINAEILAGQGDLVAFSTTTFGTTRRSPLLAVRAGVLELVAGDGLTLPSGVQINFLPGPVWADKRSVAFTAFITDPNDVLASDAVYLARNGTITEIARNGQLAPNGETYDDFTAALVKGSRVSFGTNTNGGRTCFVRASGPTHRNLGCEDDPIVTPVGTTLSNVELDTPALGSRGPVFRGQVLELGPNECLFTATTSGPVPVVCSGALLPNGGAISNFNTIALGASRRRVVSFVNGVDFDASGLYGFGPNARARIATNALPTPLGGFYNVFDPRPSIFGKTVAFVSDIDAAGTRQQALFLATLRR